MAVVDLLADRRPHRADARRNFDALLVAAREAFSEFGVNASLEDIARRAAVGIGTLYRHFPTREQLVESVYLAEVDALCRFANDRAEQDPWEALAAWLDRFVSYLGTKQVLVKGLNSESGTLRACREALYATGGPLLTRAQQAGLARTDTTIDDVMRLIIGITAGAFQDDAQRERVLKMALDGIRVHQLRSSRPETG